MSSSTDHLFPGQDTLFSPCRDWRYFLRRPLQQQIEQGILDKKKQEHEIHASYPPIVFCLLNPSTADEFRDDPTVARCRRFAAMWGYGDVIILNAFSFRATDPERMKSHGDPVGPDNDKVIRRTIDHIQRQNGKIVCGWGNHGSHLDRSKELRLLLSSVESFAFPLTKSGEPGHPLYLKNTVQPVRFT